MTITQPNTLQHPGMLAEAERRSAQVQLRAADAITAFAGSMNFVASELELHSNTELTKLVHQLTTEIHARLVLSADPKSGDA